MIRGALRRSLWFTVISAFTYGSGTTIAVYVRITRQHRERERRREGREKKKGKKGASGWAEISLCVYRAIFAITFNPARCLFLSFSHSPPFLCSRDRSLLSFILACFGTMRLRCANDRAADIGNYSL